MEDEGVGVNEVSVELQNDAQSQQGTLEKGTSEPVTTPSKGILGEEEEAEYKLYQAKIQEEMDASQVKRRAEEMLAKSNYTGASVEPAQPTAAQARKESLNIDSLLRLFKSDFFDSWIGISYLFRYPGAGVHDYLCNQLYQMPDPDMEFYLVELW
jgi:hypothetical protein